MLECVVHASTHDRIITSIYFWNVNLQQFSHFLSDFTYHRKLCYEIGDFFQKTSYNFLFECLIKTFSKQKNVTVLISEFLPFFIGPFSVIGILKSSYKLAPFFYLSLTTCVKGEIIQTFVIMHNYETMLVIILGNLNIYVVKSKKSQNNKFCSKLGSNSRTRGS